MLCHTAHVMMNGALVRQSVHNSQIGTTMPNWLLTKLLRVRRATDGRDKAITVLKRTGTPGGSFMLLFSLWVKVG